MKNIVCGIPHESVARSASYRVQMDGHECFVYATPIGSYCLLSAEGEVHVDIEALFGFEQVCVKPMSQKIMPEIAGKHICFTAEAPAKLSIEPDGDIRNPLFLLINPPETNVPDLSDENVIAFRSGNVYDAGEIVLSAGQTLYIEAGAVVYGNVVAHHADGARIAGRGILCGCKIDTADESKNHQVLKIVQSKDIVIEGITLIGGPNWHVVPIACENVIIRDLNVITWKGTGDGIDLVGDENVTVQNCFVRSMDDCIALKSVHYMDPSGCKPVRNVHVSKCVFWNAEWGNAIEIGYETQSEEICNVVFEDIDVIRAEFEGYESGGTFTIHNGDRAVVHDVLYNNIRVEDSREKLIDIKILYSQYSKDAQRGQVHGIRFKDIRIVDGLLPVSITRGYDGEHMIEDIQIENLTYLGKKLTCANEAKMVVELSKNVRFL